MGGGPPVGEKGGEPMRCLLPGQPCPRLKISRERAKRGTNLLGWALQANLRRTLEHAGVLIRKFV